MVIWNGKLLNTSEWLQLRYIEGLEWATVIPKHIAEHIKDKEKLIDTENASFIQLSDEISMLQSKKSIMEHNRKDYAEVYPCFKDCLRPGFSKWNVMNVRECGEDLYFIDDEYQIEGNFVKFSRGQFDFVKEGYR